jgi:hypothetical protein
MRSKHNSYEKEILLPLKILSIMYGIYVIVNLSLPIYRPLSFGVTSIFSYISIVSVGIGVIGAHGYFGQPSPLLPCLLVRLVQFVITFLKPIGSKKLILVSFLLLLILDIVINIYILNDRSTYEYIEVEEESWEE